VNGYYLSVGIALAASALLFRTRQLSTTMFASKLDRVDLDSLEIELSKRLFCSDDGEFVSRELPSGTGRQFRRARTVLALEWLRNVRLHVNSVFRAHLGAARNNPDLSPRDELRVTVDFVAFHLATTMLYAVIFMFGPLYAARLVYVSLDLFNKLQLTSGDLLPTLGHQVSASTLRTPRKP